MHCHRPFCHDCQIETGYGLFCSMLCAEEAHGQRVQLKRPASRKKNGFSLHGLINGVLALVFVALAVTAILYFLSENERTWAALQRLMRTVTRFFRRAF